MPEEQIKAGNVWVGFALGSAANLVAFALLATSKPILLLGFGALQVVWLAPVYLLFRVKGGTETAKGVLIAAGICLLLNAACWGLVLSLRR